MTQADSREGSGIVTEDNSMVRWLEETAGTCKDGGDAYDDTEDLTDSSLATYPLLE